MFFLYFFLSNKFLNVESLDQWSQIFQGFEYILPTCFPKYLHKFVVPANSIWEWRE